MNKLLSVLFAALFAAGFSVNASAAKHLAAEKAETARPAGAQPEEKKVMTEEEKKKMKEAEMKKDPKKY